MDVNPVGGFLANNTASGGSEGSLGALTNEFDSFLNILLTQIQHQDPLSPMESSDFTQQLVGFSQVEQSIQSNNKLQALVDISVAGQVGNSVNYAGKEVEIESNGLVAVNGKSATFSYELDKPADEATVTIRDAQNKVVFNAELSQLDKGTHLVDWDRTNSEGILQPAGKYTVTVSAKYDDVDEFEEVTTFTRGLVTGVNLSNSDIISLFIEDELEVPLEKVRFVGMATAESQSGFAPVLTNFAGTTEYTHGNEPVSLDDNLGIKDSDSETIAGVIVTIDNIKNGDNEKLNVELAEGISIESNQDGIMILTGVATKEAYEQVLRSLTYENRSTEPSTVGRQISIIVSDGSNTSNKVTKTIEYK
jgi:flagellar basal-body rod modification protein FlgD